MEHNNRYHKRPRKTSLNYQQRLSRQPRIFLALDLDPRTRFVFSQLIDSLKKYPQSKLIRWVPSENLHLTLRFIGNFPLSKLYFLTENIRKAIRGMPIFKIKFDKLLPFPSKLKPQVFAVDIKYSVMMQNLLNNIENACINTELPPQQRPQRAHITLGRFRDPTHVPSLEFNLASLDFEMRVDTITLFQSEQISEQNRQAGTKYIMLEKIPLA